MQDGARDPTRHAYDAIMRDALCFRIVDVDPRATLPPSMLLVCETLTDPPIPFAITMQGRGLDDPCAGHSPKWLWVGKPNAAAFLTALGQIHGQRTLPVDVTSRIGHRFTTTLIDRSANGACADKWFFGEDNELELSFDYDLAQRVGQFTAKHGDPDAILRRLATVVVPPGDVVRALDEI